MEKTEKRITASTAMSILTGRLCGGFAEIHEAMDVFYPGIMTLGCAAMLPRAQGVIRSQCPDLAAAVDQHPHIQSEDVDTFLAAVKDLSERFPDGFTISGPDNVDLQTVKSHFDDLIPRRQGHHARPKGSHAPSSKSATRTTATRRPACVTTSTESTPEPVELPRHQEDDTLRTHHQA